MTRTRLSLVGIVAGFLAAALLPACQAEDDPPAGPSGAAGVGGAVTNGGSAGSGTGGGSSAMGGTAGSSAGSGAGGSAGSVSSGGAGGGTGGAMAGAGGAAGSAGVGAAGGSAGAGAGTGGAAGASAGSSGSAGASMGGAGCGDAFVADIDVQVHEDVNTLLVVTWTQTVAADETWIEFEFEPDNPLRSPAKAGTMGAHTEVLLGTPGDTEVTARIVSRMGSVNCSTTSFTGTTDPLPSGMPLPTIISYDPTIASSDRYLFGAVEDSDGGSTQGYYYSTFWLYIMDRKGRIVWYYADPATLATSSFQRIARDGEYIWIEKRCFGCSGFSESVLKMTLDHSYEEEIPVEGLADAIDVTDDGALLFDRNDQLWEMNKDGDFRMIWDCADHFGGNFQCYTNTINWSEADNTVVMSYPDENTVIQVSRVDGEVIGQYGDAPGSYEFAPPLTMPPSAWGFGFQHNPNISIDGTLVVSSHMPGYTDFNTTPTPNQHAFLEFTIDRANERLIEKWRYTEGTEWPRAKGMALRLANGNTLGNYGTGGVIREVTMDKRTAFHVKFDAEGGNDAYNKMVGNNVLIDDLYLLNGGGPE